MNTELFNLEGKTAIVTGGANGIGKGCSLMLSDAGANIVVADLKFEDAQKAADEINDKGGKAMRPRADDRRKTKARTRMRPSARNFVSPVVEDDDLSRMALRRSALTRCAACTLIKKAIAVSCNVTKDEDLTNLVKRTIDEFSSINILVNNVGGGGAGKESPSDISVDDFARTFQLNVFSAWRLSQLCAPEMKKSGYGSIISMSSMSSVNKSPAISAYASSKAAINHMTANLAFDYGPEVRINAVAPGAVKTDALASVLTPEREKKMLSHTPLDRLGKPEDIAGAVLYFAAPISSWVSGQVLFVNGGGVQTLD